MPSIRPKPFDVRKLRLSPEEGFVLSRVVGSLPLTELVAICGLDEQRVLEIVRSLAQQGALEIEGETVSLGSGTGAEAASYTFAVCGVTDVGLARSNNEDAFAVVDLSTGEKIDVSEHTLVEADPRGMLLVVSDGMGGENAGEIASALAVDVICSHVVDARRDEDPAEALRAAVEHANALIVSAASEPGREGMGATAVALLVCGETAYTAEVGDSRAYVVRDGALTQITKDQTYVQLLLDRGAMSPESVKSSKAKNVILQGLGKAPELCVAQRRLALRNGDRLLLCSDGLSSFITDVEIASALASSPSLGEACARLVAMANERGGQDNITVIAAMITGPLPPPSAGESVAETLTTLRDFSLGD